MDKRAHAVFFVILLCTFSCCVNNAREPEKPAGIQAGEVLDKSFSISSAASTYSYKMTMRASMPSGIAAGAAMDVMSATGRVDKTNKKMHIATVNPLQSGQNTDTYIIGTTYYGRLSSGEWVKQETAGDELWKREALSGLQGELINSSTVSFLPEEKLEAADCYVLNITPHKDKLPELLGKSSGVDEQTLDSIISASIREWVDKESFYMKKVLFSVDMNDSGKTIRMETEITFSGYGLDQEIELPEGAKNAKTLEAQTAKKQADESITEAEGR